MPSDLIIPTISNRDVTDAEVISYLSQLSVDVGKFRDKFGRTALHMAASCGRPHLAGWLVIKRKSNINARDFDSGYTPLHRSIHFGNIEVAVKLLQLGADSYITDNDGLTPFDFLIIDRPNIFEISNKVPCQVYVWGENNNNTLGTGTGNARKHPDLLNQFKSNKLISIIQVAMEEYHSIFVSSCGRVWSCGHGEGGRLGLGFEKHVLLPMSVRISQPCVKAQVALNHTLLMLANGNVVAFGDNTFHQLGVYPYVKNCLKPHPVHLSKIKIKFEGLCAAKYHSVFFDSTSLFTCGLNGGQLGHPPTNDPFISTPALVLLRPNKEVKITHVASSIGAIVIVTSCGDIYNLHEFQCQKISSKKLGIVQVAAIGGKIKSNIIFEAEKELKIVILNGLGEVFIWEQNCSKFNRYYVDLKRIIIKNIFLNNNHILFTTSSGETFQGTARDDKPSRKTETYHHINCKKFLNIHRAVEIISDLKGNNFAVIQSHPRAALTEIPIMSPSKTKQQLESLLEDASEGDYLHDVLFNLDGISIPAHRYILSLENSLLGTLVQNGGTIEIVGISSVIFKQFLLYVYTGHCELMNEGYTFKGSGNQKDDPLDLLSALATRYEILSLSKKLLCLSYQNHCITMNKGIKLVRCEVPKMERSLFPEFCDIDLHSNDGKVVKAHKCVLATKLVYFYNMFMGGWSESVNENILKLPFPALVLQDIIDFLYTDLPPKSLSMDDCDLDHTVSLLIASDQLLIERLKEACEIALSGLLSLRNIGVILQLSFTYNTEQLQKSAMDFIHLNLSVIIESRALEILDNHILEEIGKYVRERNKLIYGKRIIPIYLDSPSVEEIRSAPLLDWSEGEGEDELSYSIVQENKTPKTSSIKKKSVKYVHYIKNQQLEMNSDKCLEHTILTPPESPRKSELKSNDDVIDEKLFPSLNTTKMRKKSNFVPISPPIIPLPKISQKQRKKLTHQMELPIEEKPKQKHVKGWASLSNPSEETVTIGKKKLEVTEESKKFIDIIASDIEKRKNLSRMRTKSFTLTQLEDKAMEELLEFYNANNVFDEHIQVRRVIPVNIAEPTWIKSHKLV